MVLVNDKKTLRLTNGGVLVMLPAGILQTFLVLG